MEIKLTEKPKGCTIIEGFPGFGLVGTITTEFLIDHLDSKLIGKIILDDMQAIVAIHDSKLVEPLGIFYNKKYNIVIVHAISSGQGHEWKISQAVSELAEKLSAKEIISIEGVGSAADESQQRTFYYSNDAQKQKKLSKITDPLTEGIIMGVTGAIMLRVENVPISCIFAETHTDVPDSKAAAKIIKVLDQYLGLQVDIKPLLQQASKFEDKIKGIIGKSREAEEMSEKKKLSYVG